jgi:hypothetical protein
MGYCGCVVPVEVPAVVGAPSPLGPPCPRMASVLLIAALMLASIVEEIF